MARSSACFDQIFHLVLGLGGANSRERLGRVLQRGLGAARLRLPLRCPGLLAGCSLAHAVDGLLQVVQGIFQLALIAPARAHLAQLLLVLLPLLSAARLSTLALLSAALLTGLPRIAPTVRIARFGRIVSL